MGKIKIVLLAIIIVVIILIAVAIILLSGGNLGIGNNKLGSANIAEEIYGFSGEIKEISNKTLTLEALIPVADLTAELVKATIKINVGEQTKITKLKFSTGYPGDTEPVYPKEIALSLDELVIGDNINVFSLENMRDNLKNGSALDIAEIFLVEK